MSTLLAEMGTKCDIITTHPEDPSGQILDQRSQEYDTAIFALPSVEMENWTGSSDWSPILFNIYINDQPANFDTRKFNYADDTTVTAQNFGEIEDKLTRADATYCESKSQDCAFHLRNRQANRKERVNRKLSKELQNPINFLDINLKYTPEGNIEKNVWSQRY